MGTAQIELGDLHDQSVHELSLKLIDQSGRQQGTTLNVEVQWMYNKVSFISYSS